MFFWIIFTLVPGAEAKESAFFLSHLHAYGTFFVVLHLFSYFYTDFSFWRLSSICIMDAARQVSCHCMSVFSTIVYPEMTKAEELLETRSVATYFQCQQNFSSWLHPCRLYIHHERVGGTACTPVYPGLCHSVFAQTESDEITSMTHGTFIKGSFHIEVFTLFQSMPSCEPPRHQYVDALLCVDYYSQSSSQNLPSHSRGGGPRDPGS